MSRPMVFHSTRDATVSAGLSLAIAAGLAPDGGLYVPAALPRQHPADFAAGADLAETACQLLQPFFAGDPLEVELPAICREAFTFQAPLRTLGFGEAQVLELFHGPTAAFKDFGARFLAACLRRLPRADARPLTILVATSGDTGAAVGAAFDGLPGLQVMILYPDGKVSPRQAHQLGSFGGNVQALKVTGRFDDCQRMVKAALNDGRLQADVPLSSANSISLGRLLPQMAYYAQACLQEWQREGRLLNLIIPTGNLGNALAATWVRAMGLPIGEIVLSCNANRTLPDYFDGQDYRPREAVATLANAMDVGAPSNFERLRWTFPEEELLRRHLRAFSIDDADIMTSLKRHALDDGELLCPHTSTAAAVLDRLRQAADHRPWTLVATAHPAKFETVIEPLISRPVAVPPALQTMLDRPARARSIPPSDSMLAACLRAFPSDQ